MVDGGRWTVDGVDGKRWTVNGGRWKLFGRLAVGAAWCSTILTGRSVKLRFRIAVFIEFEPLFSAVKN